MNQNALRNIIIGLGGLLLAGLICAAYLGLTYRHVDRRVSLKSATLAAAAKPLHYGVTFRVAMANVISPAKSYDLYHDLAELLAREAGQPLELISGKSYSEVNDLLRESKVDLVFICLGGLASAPETMEVIAVPVMDGRKDCHVLIIVPNHSPAATLSDLKGQRFLYVDPESETGYWYVQRRLAAMGEDPKEFFAKVFWTGSHDRSIQAVSQNMAEGAAVNSFVLAWLSKTDPILLTSIRVLEKSPSLPNPPVVVRKTMPISMRNHLAKVLIELGNTENGRALLKKIGLDGYVPASNSDYQAIVPPEGPK